MENITRLKYDDLNIISKKFHNEAEDYAQLHSFTLIKVDALRGQWEGEAAEKFFDEMDAVLLPALKRVSQSLDFSQQALVKIMKIIYEADEETVSYFNESGAAAGGGEFGAGLFTAAGVAAGVGVLGGGIAGAVAGGAGGAGAGTQTPPPFGSSTPGEAPPEGGQPPAGEPQQTQTQADAQAAADAPPETPGGGGGGGGGGGAGGSGLQGDLKNLGVGLNGSPAVGSSVGGIHLGAENLPDHDFGGGSGGGLAGGGGAGGAGGTGGGSGDGGGTGAPGSGVGDGVAAGVAGIAGSAAIGGAAKVVKDKQQN